MAKLCVLPFPLLEQLYRSAATYFCVYTNKQSRPDAALDKN